MKNTPKILNDISFIDDFTVKIVFENDIQIEKNDIQDALEYYDIITNGRPFKKLLITGFRTSIKNDARKFGHEQMKLRKKQIVAEAFVVHNLPQRMVVNFYNTFIKKAYPIKFFNDEESALQWLNSIQNPY
jgi:hypothetical protein